MTTQRLCALTAAGMCSLAAGCNDRSISGVTPAQNKVEIHDIPVTANRNVDLLFVVDDSGSMKAEQDSLRGHFKDFITRLSAIDGGLPDVHLGIISTDVGTGPGNSLCTSLGDDGHLLTHGCAGLDPGATFISDIATEAGPRTRNYTGNLEDVFSCMADLGTLGCGAEQPLESMRLALDPARDTNPGFLRDDSLLAIVIISDEDDCSTKDRSMFTRPGTPNSVVYGCTEFGLQCDEADLRAFGDKHHCVAKPDPQYLFDVDEYVALIDQLRPDPDKLVIATITGQPGCVRIEPNPDPRDPGSPYLAQLHECDASVAGAAYPALRTAAFRDAFTAPTYVPIGNGNIADALDQVAKAISSKGGTWCVEGTLADVNPRADGPQYDCAVTDIQHPRTANEIQTVVPECDAGHSQKPCWSIVPDEIACASYTTHLKMDIDRGDQSVPSDTHVSVECVTQ